MLQTELTGDLDRHMVEDLVTDSGNTTVDGGR